MRSFDGLLSLDQQMSEDHCVTLQMKWQYVGDLSSEYCVLSSVVCCRLLGSGSRRQPHSLKNVILFLGKKRSLDYGLPSQTAGKILHSV